MNQIEALFRATTSLTSDLDLGAILPKALRILRSILDCDNAAVLLLDGPESRVLRIRASVGYRPEVVDSLRLPVGEGITGWVMKTGRTANVADVSKDRRYVEGVAGARSEIAVPLISEGRRVGVLDIESKRKNAFRRSEDVQILKIFASHLATAIANAERWEQIEQQNRRLELSTRVSRIATSTLNLAEMLDRAARVIRPSLRCTLVDVLLYDPTAQELIVRASAATRRTRVPPKGTRIPVGQGLVGAAARRKRPLVVPDVRRDDRYRQVSPSTRSEIVVPLHFRGDVLGLLNAESSRIAAFGRAESELLQAIGSILAAAIHNAMLYGELIDFADRVVNAQAFTRQINAHLETGDLLDTVIGSLPMLVGANRCSVFLADENRRFRCHAHNHPGAADPILVDSRSDTVVGRLLRERTSVNATEGAGSGRPEDPDGPHLGIVLQVGDRVEGVITLSERSDPGPFSDHDLQFAAMVGEHLAVAVANARLYEQTLERSVTDGLTGLLIHRAFYEELDRTVEAARDDGSPLGIIMGDIDRFKSVNDRFGHPFGDQVLARVGQLVADSIRPGDLAARYGGEEFCVLLPNNDAQEAAAVAERIRQRLAAENFEVGGRRVRVTISFGVTELRPGDADRSAIVDRVDRALYQAKSAGRNRTRIAAD